MDKKMCGNNQSYQKKIHKNYCGIFQAKKNAAVLLPLVRRWVSDSILDIGGADGSLLTVLKQKGYRHVQAVDIVPAHHEVTEGSLTDLPYDDNSFSTVFSTEVFEHLSQEQIADGLTEVFRVLRQGGTFIVTVPYREKLANNTLHCPECDHSFHRYGHLQVFDEGRICNLLKKYGFCVDKMGAYALGAMGLFPGARFFNGVFKRLGFESVAVTLVVVAVKPKITS